MFGIKIDLKKLAGTVAKVAGPAIVTAVVLHQPLKKAVLAAARAELDKRT